ncbi:MAG: 3-oxoacyl-[acyl-carrier-protein] reductase [Clostridiales Family XIII bacterium]|jgi:3-oxoacyl-[acyl-carrier protein] reductase|nr:3-oxoacyl-[acyl-carrier-protein] reductase [Clostridiales Family XIII bacterium]
MKGKIAVITGGTRGIGRATAFELADRGADLALTYRGNDAAAEETRRALTELGVKVELLRGDAADPEHSKHVAAVVKEKFGRIDILVNNAGITRDKLMLRMDAEDFDDVIKANLNGAFYMMAALAPMMIKQRYGRIINVSSVAGLRGNPAQVNYAASKAGLVGMTLSAAKELGARGVTVNAVAPGYIETDMTEVLTDEQKANMIKVISLRRAGTPAEVAKAIAFLASDAAAYITGQVLGIDGGISV